MPELTESMQKLYEEAHEVARHLEKQPFPDLAEALRARTSAILERWRKRSIEVIPSLDDMTIVEFEDSIAKILSAMAQALEKPGTDSVHQLIEASPEHGVSRFAQSVEPHVMLAEERILRSAIIVELRAALDRPLIPEEAAAFHSLFDLMSEYSLLRLMRERGEARDKQILNQVSGMHRLADLGTLAAGLAHDAANLMLPMRTRLDFLASVDLPSQAREDVEGLLLFMEHLQHFITNLRMLSVDPHRRGGAGAPGQDGPQQHTIDLAAWWDRDARFHRRMLPYHIELRSELPADLPRIAISAPILAQAVFNLVRNAQNAMRGQTNGCITVRAAAGPDGRYVDLSVQDDGPGMPPEVLAHCFDPFFSAQASSRKRGRDESGHTGRGGAGGARGAGSAGGGNPGTEHSGSGLGLAIVNTLVVQCGGRVTAQSPPPGKPHGAVFVLSLPAAG